MSHRIGGIGLVILALFLAVLAGIVGIHRLQAGSQWAHVTGTVVGTDPPGPVWAYEVDGRRIRAGLPYLSDPSLQVGDRVPLVVNRKDPAQAQFDNFFTRYVGTYGLPAIIGFVALGSGAIGTLILIFAKPSASGPRSRRRGMAAT